MARMKFRWKKREISETFQQEERPQLNEKLN
jgi:hypothetical protein